MKRSLFAVAILAGCTTAPPGEDASITAARITSASAEKQAQITADARRDVAKTALEIQKAKAMAAITDCGATVDCSFARVAAIHAMSGNGNNSPIIVNQPAQATQAPTQQAAPYRSGMEQFGGLVGTILEHAIPIIPAVLTYRLGELQSNNSLAATLSTTQRDIAVNGQNVAGFTTLGTANKGTSYTITGGQNSMGASTLSTTSATGSYNPTSGSYNPSDNHSATATPTVVNQPAPLVVTTPAAQIVQPTVVQIPSGTNKVCSLDASGAVTCQ
jgi:hypothetical protein